MCCIVCVLQRICCEEKAPTSASLRGVCVVFVFVAVYVLQLTCCSVCVCCRGSVVKEKMKEISDMKIAAKVVRSMRVCCSVWVAVCVAVYVS